MGFDIDQFRTLLLLGHGLDVAAGLLVTLGVAAWFVWHTTRHPLARRVLWLVLVAGTILGVLLFAGFIALLVYSDRGGYAIGFLLLPLGVVFGLRGARRYWTRMQDSGTTLGRSLWRLLLPPALIFASLYFVLAELSLEGIDKLPLPLTALGAREIDTGSSTQIGFDQTIADAVLGILRFLGYGSLYFFFLSIPYVTGRLVTAALLVLAHLGWDRPMRVRDEGDDAAPSKDTR